MKAAIQIFILLIAFLIHPLTSQQCTTKFNLDNLLQDQVVISPATPNSTISETQQYFYPRTFFTTTPKIISSIQTYQVSSFSEINYQLKTNVSRSFVTFTFTADKMQWTYLKVKFWLTARVDLLVGTFSLENITPDSSSTFSISIPTTFSPFIDQKSIQLNFITGLKATTTGANYEVNVLNQGRSSDNTIFKVMINATGQTTITFIEVSYAIFNFQSSYFASGGGTINYVPISTSEYSKIHGSFAPIIYEIEGFDRIVLPKNGGLNLEYIFDTDFVLQTKVSNKIEWLSVVYLSIGAQPKGVCSCDQFIMQGGCVDTCPAQTYPFVSYAKGGKSCLTCSAKLNQTINEFSTGCVCMQGLQRVGEYCVPKQKAAISCTANNTILSGSQCVCVSGTQLVNGNCQSFCKVNQNFNSVTLKCECAFGYFNISGTCGVCSSDKIYDSSVGACVCLEYMYVGSDGLCVCIPNYFVWEGKCVKSCPSGYTKSNNTCVKDTTVIPTTCPLNQILTNNICTCPSPYYIVNGNCTTCLSLSYYNVTSQTCIPCLANCQICFSTSSCSTCKSGYYYNQTSNSCQVNKTCLDNQVLSNGACVCAQGFVEVSGACANCLAGTFYNSVNKTCQKCVISCLACTNASSCNTCLPNYAFNATIGYCAPICGANQTLVNGSCQCTNNTYRLNGVCSRCQSAQFYDSTTKSCVPCMLNCITCTSALSCDKCIITHYFNTTTKTCQPSNCPVNQTIVNNKCDCVDGTYRVSGVCSVCKPDQFYDSSTQFCKQCTENCQKCLNMVQCAQCQSYFKLINGECKFNLYQLKKGYPEFSQNLIITDFASSQPSKARKLSAEQLRKMIQIQFDPKQNSPAQTLIQQNPRNSSQIRVIFSYCGFVPFTQSNSTFTFNDPSISIKEDIEQVNYNVIQAGMKSYFSS